MQYAIFLLLSLCNTLFFSPQGECTKTSQDLVERFWNFLTTLDSNIVAQFMKDNLAGTVMVLSLFIWIPASCYINHLVSKNFQGRGDALPTAVLCMCLERGWA